jgi:hypothetical protein
MPLSTVTESVTSPVSPGSLTPVRSVSALVTLQPMNQSLTLCPGSDG